MSSLPWVSWIAAALLVGCEGTSPDKTPAPLPTADMVHIADEAVGGHGGYWIDRYEFPNRAGEAPLVYTDLAAARTHCADAGKRVCTAAEWRRACAGPDGTATYGYGPTFVSRRCHTEHQLPSGHTSMMDAASLVAKSGDYPDCATPEGVFDLVGNVEEWVLDDWRGVDGMLEGGAWYTWSGYANCGGAYSREPDYRLDPSQAVFSAGFRCCTSEEAPTEATLSHDRIAADARARVEVARGASSSAAYEPANEVDVVPGVAIDIYEYPNRPGEVPRTAVSWNEASDLCAAGGKRLCSVEEWELACASPEGRRFPYGDAYVPGACSVGSGERTVAGAAFACLSVGGARDLVGGVWEWTSTPLDTSGVLPGAPRDRHEVRGGSAWSDATKGVCAPVDGYPESPADAVLPDLGFRCCRGAQAVDPVIKHPGGGTCGPGMVSLAGPRGAYCIDQFEFPNQAGGMPRGNLDLAEARAACASSGKRVCREDEWIFACTAAGRRRWPYGNVYVPDRCADRADKGGSLASGARPECVTPDGVLDQSGNLWEWTETAAATGVLHGGGWNFSAGLGQCRSRADAAGAYRDPQFGVRCCTGP